MKEEGFFYGHLGLGDHIILQGAVNHLSKSYDRFYIIAKHHNVRSVEVMCKEINSLDNIEILGVRDDDEARALINRIRGRIHQGHSCLDIIENGIHGNYEEFARLQRHQGKSFDASFYAQLGLDYNMSWGWEIKEVSVNNEILDLRPEGDFIFVHDDHSRGLRIQESSIQTDLPIVRPSVRADSIFQYVPLIKNAKEIHCMDSSFALMIDRTCGITEDIYLHQYLRQSRPAYRKKWKII